MTTSAWMKMMDRHDAERVREFGASRRGWPWLGRQDGSVFYAKPIPYRGYPGVNGEPK